MFRKPFIPERLSNPRTDRPGDLHSPAPAHLVSADTGRQVRAQMEALEGRRLLVVAFPGAEGFGANASGGRGGDVYHVTNLNDTGPGSFRSGITSATGPRTIVFDVGGTIQLASLLSINKPNLTIAGQTAPGDGIIIRNYQTTVEADNIILRHLRFRHGDTGDLGDALSIMAGNNIIVDHVSASWGLDETLSTTHQSNNVTVQYSTITETLNPTGHGFGSLVRTEISSNITYHHNFFAHNQSRNPRPGTYNGQLLNFDFRNNVIYDWAGRPATRGAPANSWT